MSDFGTRTACSRCGDTGYIHRSGEPCRCAARPYEADGPGLPTPSAKWLQLLREKAQPARNTEPASPGQASAPAAADHRLSLTERAAAMAERFSGS